MLWQFHKKTKQNKKTQHFFSFGGTLQPPYRAQINQSDVSTDPRMSADLRGGEVGLCKRSGKQQHHC